MIVLDTNVVSELMRSDRNPGVVNWARPIPRSEMYTTTVTLAEVGFGLARLPAGRRRRELEDRAKRLFDDFEDRLLSFDLAAARQYGPSVAAREAAGRPMSTADGQIAAICLVHGATLATRNVRDFDDTGVDVVDPWTAGA